MVFQFLRAFQSSVLQSGAVGCQVVLEVDGDEPDGAGRPRRILVIPTADNFPEAAQCSLLSSSSGSDAVVELLPSRHDLLRYFLALPVYDCLGHLGIFTICC